MTNSSGSDRKHVRILSIDGGGIRGIIPAEILAELEKRTGTQTSALFDLIAGTSTGGILALALCQPGDTSGKPAHSGAEMIDFYRRLGPVIFGRTWLHFLQSADGLIRSRYSDKPIDTTLQNFFGQSRLSESLTSIFVPSYELKQRTPFFFRSVRARQDPEYDYPMYTVARATSAAPTYFPPEGISCATTSQHYVLIDGGVFANNPAACALVEARVQFPEADRFTLVSLGTGAPRETALMGAPENWGLAQWARPILDTVLDGVSRTVDYQVSQVLPDQPDGTKAYYRFQPALTSPGQTLDNARLETMNALSNLAALTVKERSRDIDALCKQLFS